MITYNDFLSSDQDLAGRIAYAEFCINRTDAIEGFFQEHDRMPTEAELAQIEKNILSKESKKMFRELADDRLAKWMAFAFGKMMEEQHDVVVRWAMEGLAKEKERTRRKDYWSGIGQNLLASFIFLVGSAAIVSASYSKIPEVQTFIDHLMRIEQAGGASTTSSNGQAAPPASGVEQADSPAEEGNGQGD